MQPFLVVHMGHNVERNVHCSRNNNTVLILPLIFLIVNQFVNITKQELRDK